MKVDLDPFRSFISASDLKPWVKSLPECMRDGQGHEGATRECSEQLYVFLNGLKQNAFLASSRRSHNEVSIPTEFSSPCLS